jgi:hypothetical protein
MPRGKARPLKQVFQTALEAAKVFGYPRVKVSIPGGSTVVFSQEEGEHPPKTAQSSLMISTSSSSDERSFAMKRSRNPRF